MKSPFLRILLQLLVLALGIVLVVGALNPFGANGQSLTLTKDAGVSGVPVLTETVGTGGMVYVKVTADETVEVRIIKMSERDVDVPQDETLRDRLAHAKGKGTSVSLSSPYPNNYPSTFAILVLPTGTTNSTEADLSYTLEVSIWDPDLPMLVLGLVVIIQYGILRVVVVSLERALRTPTAPPAAPGDPEPSARERGGIDLGPPADPALAAAPPPQQQQRRPPPDDRRRYPDAPAARQSAPEAIPAVDEPPARREPPPERRGPPIAGKAVPGKEPVKRIKCGNCKSVLPIYTHERPLRILCPNCGAKGMLR